MYIGNMAWECMLCCVMGPYYNDAKGRDLLWNRNMHFQRQIKLICSEQYQQQSVLRKFSRTS